MSATHKMLTQKRFTNALLATAHIFLDLDSIATLPSHGGHGVAKALMLQLLSEADHHQLPCYLSASPTGRGLYRKLGFKELGGSDGLIEVDMGDWGGQGMYRNTAMIWHPPAKSE